MKVVISAAGLGCACVNMRDKRAKPMVPIGLPACSVARYEVLRALWPQGFYLVPGPSR